MERYARHAVSHQAAPARDPGKLSIVKLFEKEKQNGKATSNSARPFPRTGEIAILANFTKSTSNFPPFFFCIFYLLRMVRLLHLELLRERYLPSRNRRLDYVLGSQKGVINMLNYNPWRTTKLALCQRLDLRTCHRRARHRRLHPEKRATRGTACHPALLLSAGSSGSRDHGLVRGKRRARPHYLVFRNTNGAPLRCSSCLAGRRYDRL